VNFPLLQLRGITKNFPGVTALANVDLTVRPGEVHALMGENGAGKSTLIKVLTGVYRRDGGKMEFDGRRIDPRSPQEAQSLGISTVYQEVNLIPHLSVAENISLGRQPTRFGCLDWREITRRAESALARLELRVDVGRPLASFSLAIQQLVAIARALDISAKLLIFDEPTSSLDEKEVAELFCTMRKLKADGLGLVFVTHYLDQVYAIADCITVLRNGRCAGEFKTASLPRLELIACMMGKNAREIQALSLQKPAVEKSVESQPFLEARRIGRRKSLAPLDLDIAAGEIVGLAGLLGSGRTEVARLLFGIDRADTGVVRVEGKPVALKSPRRAIRCRFGFCPEDRKTEGIIPDLSVRENIILALQAGKGWLRSLSRREQEEIAGRYIKALNIVTADAGKPVKLLSGGNQQKAILARWLASQPRLLILDEPTRGVDVGAKLEIEKLIAKLAGDGMAILLISSELEEIVRTSQRVIVLRDRAKIAELLGSQISEAQIMHAIAGPPVDPGA
jgi:galactofuranose transport system ATP-binding protein